MRPGRGAGDSRGPAGRGEGAGAAGAAGPRPGENLREAEDLLRRPGEPRSQCCRRRRPPPLTPRPPQEQLPAASDAELRALDEAIAALSAKVQAAQQSCRHMEAGECALPTRGDPPAAPGAPGG